MRLRYFTLRSLVEQNDPGTSYQKQAGVSLNQIWEGKKKYLEILYWSKNLNNFWQKGSCQNE